MKITDAQAVVIYEAYLEFAKSIQQTEHKCIVLLAKELNISLEIMEHAWYTYGRAKVLANSIEGNHV